MGCIVRIDTVPAEIANSSFSIIAIKIDIIAAKAIFNVLSNGNYIEKFSLDYLTLDEIFKDKVGGQDE